MNEPPLCSTIHLKQYTYVVIKIHDLRYVRLLTAGVPGQGGGGGEADHQVEDGPGHDHAVVHVQEAHLGPGVSVDTLLLCVPSPGPWWRAPCPPAAGTAAPPASCRPPPGTDPPPPLNTASINTASVI